MENAHTHTDAYTHTCMHVHTLYKHRQTHALDGNRTTSSVTRPLPESWISVDID